MLDLLLQNPLLTLMVVIGLGTVIGMIPFGPVKFGPAGALFVGLAVGGLDPALGKPHAVVQSLGLALFVYTVGIASGAAFFRGLRSQLGLMLASIAVLIASTAIVVGVAKALGIGSGYAGGAFAGSLTSTPTLAAATVATGGSKDPAVAYALSYPVGVILTIIIVNLVMARSWSSAKDPAPAAADGLVDVSVEVDHPTQLAGVPGVAEGNLRFSYLSHDGDVRLSTSTGDRVERGDRVVLIGPKPTVETAIAHLGHRVDEHLAHDRSVVDFQRVLLSNKALAGRTIGSLGLPTRYGATITRLRRGDLELLAHDDLVVELGDRLRVVAPRERLGEVVRFLGNSERRVSEIDALSLALGLVLGILVGLIKVPLPGGAVLSLGVAAGPLVVGMILGYLERTGPIVWGLPTSANTTLRQVGLLLFLAAVGLASGSAFVKAAPTMLGAKIALLAAANVIVSGILMVWLARRVGASGPRTAGGLAGFVGQPAILAVANSKTMDERIDAGYATLFALDIVLKIVLVQVVCLL